MSSNNKLETKKHSPHYVFTEIEDENIDGVDVIIDTREKSKYKTAFINRFIEMLEYFGYTWKKAKLPAGDILINRGRGLAIERKTVGDLIGTAQDQRQDGNALESELSKLKDPEIFGGYEIPTCLCCENAKTISITQEYVKKIVTKTKYGKQVECVEYEENRSFSYKDHNGKRITSKIYPNSWTSITYKVQMYTQYIEFGGVDHFISWIIARIKAEIKREKDAENGFDDVQELRMNNKVNKLTMSEQQRYIMEGIPGLGLKGAINSLEWAGNLRLFFLNTKNSEDLIDIGINRPTSEYILSLIDHQFDRNEVTKKKVRKYYHKN